MNRTKIWMILLSLTTVGMVSACGQQKVEEQQSCNFVRNSELQRVSWKDQTPLPLYIHSSVPTQYHDKIKLAARQWEISLGRQIFVWGGVTSEQNTPSGAAVVYWHNVWDNNRPDEQARTIIQWRGNKIYKADLRVNAMNFVYSTSDVPDGNQVDLQSLALHELGHVLGLDHIHGTVSVMDEHLASGSLRRTPEKVDVDSLHCEY